MRRNIVVTFITIIAFILGALSFYLFSYYFPMNVEITKINKLEIRENSISESVEKIFDATVVVEVYRNSFLYSTGSGFVYKKDDKDAYIITNSHVVDNGTAFNITFSNDTMAIATLVGRDAMSDLAILKVSADKVTKVATFGDSSKINTGDIVFTIGSPESSDYSGTVTKGIVSSKERFLEMTGASFKKYALKVIQTDAAINPGNSGGPLVNVNGEVIGVTSLKLGTTEKIEGIGFAIPINEIKTYIDKLEKGTEIQRGAVDFSYVSLSDSSTINRMGLTSDGTVTSGVMVILPGLISSFKAGDIITEVNNTKVTNSYFFDYLISKYEPNTTVDIKYYNGKEFKTMKVKLVTRKQ